MSQVVDVQVGPEARLTDEQVRVAQDAAAAAIAAAGHCPQEHSLTVVITGDAEMARLNEQFRGAEGPTDVLAFAFGSALVQGQEEAYLGDVIVSLERAVEQAQDVGHSLERELALLVAHGVLHLLGFDHAEAEDEREMWSLQDRVAQEVAGAQG